MKQLEAQADDAQLRGVPQIGAGLGARRVIEAGQRTVRDMFAGVGARDARQSVHSAPRPLGAAAKPQVSSMTVVAEAKQVSRRARLATV